MIPKKIHRVWLGGSMPAEFVEFGERWQALHPDWTVTTWHEDDLGWIANRAAFDDAPLLSSKANIARYEIIRREGGLYVDCDVEPLRAIDELLGDADLVVSEEHPGYLGNEFFAAVADHPVLVDAVENVSESHFARPDAISPARTGPEFWTRCVRRTCARLGITPVTLRRDQVYPYTWSQTHLRHAEFSDAWAVHHWAKSWVGAGAARPVAPRHRTARAGIVALSRIKRGVRAGRAAWARLPPVDEAQPTITALGASRLIASTSDGIAVLLDAEDRVVAPAIALDGTAQPAYAAFLRRELGAGTVIVEVGARSGLNTVRAAKCTGISGRVFAYEADPRQFQLLEETVDLNRRRGLAADVSVSASRIGAGSEVDGSTSLDDDLGHIAELSLVRVESASAAPSVLAGLATLIGRRRVRLLDVRVDDRQVGAAWQPFVDGLRQLVADHGATTFTIDGAGRRIPLSLSAAIHSEPREHVLFDFGPATS